MWAAIEVVPVLLLEKTGLFGDFAAEDGVDLRGKRKSEQNFMEYSMNA